MTETHPYLSIVTVSRNDDHGGNLLRRMQLFIDSLYDQCNRYKIDTELIIVEWNPPVEKESLFDALNWPRKGRYVTTRIITVPPEVHNRFRHAHQMPVFQMIGKNVGIRRATGTFVLATNIDILFSDELMEFLSSKKLEEGHQYRVDRIDVASPVLDEYQRTGLFASCRKNRIRLNTQFGTYDYRTIRDFIPVFLKHRRDYLFRVKTEQDYGYPLIHTNACGDFTLMARKNWIDLGGYPELQMYSFHIDSLLLVLAHYLGIREMYLKSPREIYHIEHRSGSGWTPGGGEKKLFERLDKEGISYLVWNDLMKYSSELRETGDPAKTTLGVNEPDWGLLGVPFPEKTVQPALPSPEDLGGKITGEGGMLSEICRSIETGPPVSNEFIFRDFSLLSGHPWQDTVQSTVTTYYGCLYCLIQEEKPLRILEIGTAFGMSSATMIKASPGVQLFISLDLGIYADQMGFSQDNIDYARRRIHSWCCRHHIPLARVRFYRANSQPEGLGDNEDRGSDIRRWHQIPDLVRLLTREDFDVIFVDGKHTGDGLYNDFASFWPMLKEGGLLICDDLHDEVTYRDIFPWAGQTLSSFNRFSGEHAHEIEESFVWNYPHVLPEDFRGLRPFGLIRRKKREITPTAKEFGVFDDREAMEINTARLDHLASLGLDLAHKSVLEVGSGIGKHTEFFEKLGCRVTSTDARPENVAEHLRRYPYRKGRVEVADLNEAGSHKKFGSFDIVYCYGTLYHLSNPQVCLQELAGNCRDLFLLETCVNSYDNHDINCLPEENRWKNQSFDGTGCRPARDWIVSELKKYYPYVYCTRTQPVHRDFPLSWPADARHFINTRAVFVGSRVPQPSRSLITEIPAHQTSLESLLDEEGEVRGADQKPGEILEGVRRFFMDRLPLSVSASLFDKSGEDLLKMLETASYGAHPDEGAVVQEDTSFLYKPTDIRDHLATPFLPLRAPGGMAEHRLRLTVSYSSKYPPGKNCIIYLQDQAFTRLSSPLETDRITSSEGETRFVSQTITVPKNVTKFRILITTSDGKPTHIPFSFRVEKLTPKFFP